MKDSDTPTKIPLPWGANAGGGYIRVIPTTSQIGIQNGAASFHDGYPPNCFIPISSGGAGPFGQDENGVLHQITAGLQWLQAGGPIYYNSGFSTAIGGYPKGALLSNASVVGSFWISTVDDNPSNPDTGGANWQAFPPPAPSIVPISIVTLTTPGAYSTTVPIGATACVFEAWGGGGGGGYGSTTSDCASGGSSGAYGTITLPVVAAAAITGSIGAGGAGSSGAAAGAKGGDTTVTYNAVTYTAGGGFGGLSEQPSSANSPALASTAGPWASTIIGQQGNIGFAISTIVVSGQGGGAALGGPGGVGGGGVPGAGLTPGGGGGGSGNAAGNGGAGGGGEVRLTFY